MKSLSALSLLLLSVPLAAQIMPESDALNPRLQTVRWQDGQIIQLTSLPETGITVLFTPGERIERVDGDRTRVDARISSERDGLLLIPRREGLLGELTVTTDRRRYRFALRTGTDLMAAYLVRFMDGPGGSELPPAMAVSPPPGFPPMQPAIPTMGIPGATAWSYHIKGDAAVRPTSIRDDGARTMIAFAEGAALPAVFAIGPSGREQIVNGYMRGDVFVIDEIWPELVFRIDAKKATARRNTTPDGADG